MLKVSYIFGFTGVLLIAGMSVFAAGETQKSPLFDRLEVIYKPPENLEEMSLEQLRAEKATRMREFAAIKKASHEPEVARQKLLATILEHDDKRMRIVEIIPELISDYQIEGEFRDALLNYARTFDVDLRAARKHVTALNDFKSYDFRFSAAYMSMLFAFRKHPDFHRRLIADMSDEGTAIGRYYKELNQSYAKVEYDKRLIQDLYSIEELEQAIASIDREIAKRGVVRE